MKLFDRLPILLAIIAGTVSSFASVANPLHSVGMELHSASSPLKNHPFDLSRMTSPIEKETGEEGEDDDDSSKESLIAHRSSSSLTALLLQRYARQKLLFNLLSLEINTPPPRR